MKRTKPSPRTSTNDSPALTPKHQERSQDAAHDLQNQSKPPSSRSKPTTVPTAPTPATEMNSMESYLEKLSEEEQKLMAQELIRQTPEYQVAWELELWKADEKKKFKKILQEKEKDAEEKLHQQIREKEEEFEQNITNRKIHVDQLEDKYRKMLQDLEKKEKILESADAELKRRRNELEKDFERKLDDMQHHLKLNREQCAHKIELSEQRSATFEKRIQELYEELSSHSKSKKELDSLHIRVEKYENEVQQLKTENEKLKEQLIECEKSKRGYKHQSKLDKSMIEQLNKEKQDLKQEVLLLKQELKQEYFYQWKTKNDKNDAQPQPHQEHANASTTPLQKSRAKTPKKKKKEEPVPIVPPTSDPDTPSLSQAKQQILEEISKLNREQMDKEILRLVSERSSLIQTGNYNPSNQIIKLIDLKIQLMNARMQ